MELRHGRVRLRPLASLGRDDWRRVHTHFRDPEIAHLNGTPPNRLPLWLLRRMLQADARRRDRATFGVYDETGTFIGTAELYDVTPVDATLGIIIGERSHWNRGYGPEAVRALLRHAFETLGLERVRLYTYADNPRARRAFRKVGFHEVGRETQRGGRTDVRMELGRSAWLARRATDDPPERTPVAAGG